MIAFSFFFPSCPLIPSPFCLNTYSAASTMHLTKLLPRPTRIPAPLLVVVMKGVFSRIDVGRGFLAENDLVLVDNATQISLSSIPKLLQRLDLPPDDTQVLLVLKNAALGSPLRDW
jgi:hypothetical protein